MMETKTKVSSINVQQENGLRPLTPIKDKRSSYFQRYVQQTQAVDWIDRELLGGAAHRYVPVRATVSRSDCNDCNEMNQNQQISRMEKKGGGRVQTYTQASAIICGSRGLT